MKIFTFILCFLSFSFSGFANQDLPSILQTLDKTLSEKEKYSLVKVKKINALKRLLVSAKSDKIREYEINRDLFHIYKNYKCDSAVLYATRNIDVASSIQVKGWVDESKMQLASQLSVIGMHKEAFEILEILDTRHFTEPMLSYYYETCRQVYKIYSYENVYEEQYKRISISYRDSLINLLDKRTNTYKLVYAEKLIEENKPEEAKELLFFLLNKTIEESDDYAYITYALGNIFGKEKNEELEKTYYAISAVSNLINANKENHSLQLLAIAMYESNDINRAYEYSRSVIEDALFCHNHIRTAEISEIFSIVDTVYRKNSQKKTRQLQWALNLLALFSFILIVTIIYVYLQLKKLAVARGELRRVNEQLKQLNLQLNNSNHKLYEANHLKEEYIGHFLDLCSNYIEIFEDYRKMLNRKAATRQLDDLFKTLKSKEPFENILKELYNNFDTIFLQLYPDFISQINALLIPEEQFILKSAELLNTELRIYALIRLGINDSSKIARFLRYSANTIYNYRAKVKSKSLIQRDEFEKMVMKIGSLKPV
jgi:hypothetical protein